jgi:hypothetical protein
MLNMKKKPRLNGLGDRAIDNLVGMMVARAGGSCIKDRAGLQVSFPDKQGPGFIAYAPSDSMAWETRLRWVEKQSAIFLLNAPVLYGIKWEARRGKKSQDRVLRLSIGLSLSFGPPLPKRYTLTLKHGRKCVDIMEGSHLPLEKSGKAVPLTALPKWAETDRKHLAKAVSQTCEMFQSREEVRKALLALGEGRREELTCLERLYRRKQGANDRLYGLASTSTEEGSPIEAELRQLQSIVLHRYSIEVEVRILSIGVLEGHIPNSFTNPRHYGATLEN